MEIAGLVIGIAGLAAVFETGCDIWLTVTKADRYGESVANALSKLEMEFFKFQAWWVVLERLAADPRHRSAQSRRRIEESIMPSKKAQLLRQLCEQRDNPIIIAARNIQRLLEKLQAILQRNGSLVLLEGVNAGDEDKNSAKGPESQERGLSARAASSTKRHEALVARLQKSTPFRKRILHGAKPWAGADQIEISNILDEIIYWNRSLYEILPSNIRESVMAQGMAGYLLEPEDEDNNIRDLSAVQDVDAQSRVAVECAKLVDLRNRLRTSSRSPAAAMAHPLHNSLDEMQRKGFADQLPDHVGGANTFSVVTDPASNACESDMGRLECNPYADDTRPSASVLVEWYPYPAPHAGFDAQQTAAERMARLSLLLNADSRPSTLHALSALGYCRNDNAGAFGLIYQLPASYTTPELPITLHELLSRKTLGEVRSTPVLPTLESRYELAAILASSLYTFMLGRWHHKRFNSHSIFFLPSMSQMLMDQTLMSQTPAPDISAPYVGGYALSRIDDPKEISLVGPLSKELELYVHPDVARDTEVSSHDAQTRERFRRAFDVYSFGILLAEIGFWNTLTNVAGRGGDRSRISSAKQLRSRLVAECESKLGCWMGERYRDVTLQCLNVELDNGIGGTLNDFYLDVVLEVTKCVPTSP